MSKYTNDNSFSTVFAIFFPSAIGILSGVNISGDLKVPAMVRDHRNTADNTPSSSINIPPYVRDLRNEPMALNYKGTLTNQ